MKHGDELNHKKREVRVTQKPMENVMSGITLRDEKEMNMNQLRAAIKIKNESRHDIKLERGLQMWQMVKKMVPKK